MQQQDTAIYGTLKKPVIPDDRLPDATAFLSTRMGTVLAMFDSAVNLVEDSVHNYKALLTGGGPRA